MEGLTGSSLLEAGEPAFLGLRFSRRLLGDAGLVAILMGEPLAAPTGPRLGCAKPAVGAVVQSSAEVCSFCF